MKPFVHQHKYQILALIILAFITAVSGYVGFLPPSTVYTNVDKKNNSQPTNSSIETNRADFALNKANNTSSTALKEAKRGALATIKVYNSVYKLEVQPRSSVYDLMKQLRAQTDFSFSGKEFSGGLGFFVEEINGQRQNPKEKKYWIYYINGEMAVTGISTYIIQPNDLIEWKLWQQASGGRGG